MLDVSHGTVWDLASHASARGDSLARLSRWRGLGSGRHDLAHGRRVRRAASGNETPALSPGSTQGGAGRPEPPSTAQGSGMTGKALEDRGPLRRTRRDEFPLP